MPVWVFDIETARMTWSNEAALKVWEAETEEELCSRDFSRDMSSSVRERLLQYQRQFVKGATFDESWTLYPKGKPKSLLCRFRGCQRQDGGMAMLCEAQEVGERHPELLRGSQALLYTGAMVSTYDKAGRCLYANPAAQRAVSAVRTPMPWCSATRSKSGKNASISASFCWRCGGCCCAW